MDSCKCNQYQIKEGSVRKSDKISLYIKTRNVYIDEDCAKINYVTYWY